MNRQRLKIRRQELKLTLQDVANELGLTRATIQKYESGYIKGVDTETLEKLAKALKTTPAYLMGWDDEKNDIFSYPNVRPISKKKFRMLGKIACGEPIYANEDYETYIEASADIDAEFCLTAQGDSMINARIFDGDIVFIKAQSDVDNGEIAAVIIGDEVTLKRVYKYNNRLELRAENPTYEPLNYEGLELENIRILGKAVAFQSYVK